MLVEVVAVRRLWVVAPVLGLRRVGVAGRQSWVVVERRWNPRRENRDRDRRRRVQVGYRRVRVEEKQQQQQQQQ